MVRNLVFLLFAPAGAWARASPGASYSGHVPLTARNGGTNNHTQCRCFPGDDCWPTSAEWQAFNETVGGRLVATTPIAAVCHYDNFTEYDADACASLQQVWDYPETHYMSSSSPMQSWFANDSCNPFTSPASKCVIGAYVQYAVNATGLAEYQATLAFVRDRNLRLVIRNTGHDYLGKSTGAGALALWTHFLKDINVIGNYSSAAYSGPAVRLGAGVQAFEAYEAAAAAGLAVNGGNCDTVGIAGGYTQGGGLGPLASTFGLAADQALEWEVVTASGDHIIASPTNYSDLYWAISGGGGGTYAAVLSVTVRAHQTMKVASANLTFSEPAGSGDSFSTVLQTFLLSLPKLAEAGIWCSFYIEDGIFEMVPAFAPYLSAADLQALLDPTLASLEQNGISYDYYIDDFDTFISAYDTMVPTDNITDANIGGRLIPRSVFETNESVASLVDAFEFIVDAGAAVSGIVSNQTSFPLGGVQNSVNPAFRTSVVDVVIGLVYNDTDYSANIVLQKEMTDSLLPRLEDLTPGGGAYLNEGDPNQADWQDVFYGDNYDRLKRIKDKYDPYSLFYAFTAVGSEEWVYRMSTDGRLCRV